jgi:uncharacterized protein
MPTHSAIPTPFHHIKARHLLGQTLLIGLGLGILLAFTHSHLPIPMTDPAMVFVQYILLFGLLCLWLMGRFRQVGLPLAAIVGKVPPRYTWWPVAGLVIALLVFSMGAFLLSFAAIAHVAPQFVEQVLKGLPDTTPKTAVPQIHRLLMTVVFVGVAPLTEELIFRGFLLQRWATKWGLTTALILSSLVFGLLHANVVGLSIFGLVMAVLYVQTRTLWVPIAAHAFNNAIALVLSLASADNATPTPMSLASLQANVGPGLILITLSAPWIIWFLSRHFPRRGTALPALANQNP